MNPRRYFVAAASLIAVLFLFWIVWPARPKNEGKSDVSSSAPANSKTAPASKELTTVYAHNLELRKGPEFRIYVRWLRGEMEPVKAGQVPSLDNVDSFLFHIDRGLIHANVGDIQQYLNSSLVAQQSPLKNIKLNGEGQQLKLSGTLHKLLMPLPVEVIGTLSPGPNGRIHFAVSKINVLKIPVKALMGGLKVEVKDIVGTTPAQGIAVSDNDIYLDTSNLLPPPHIRGQITGIKVQAPDVVVTYGNTTPEDETELSRWHNFLRLRGGSLEFGKLAMHETDLTLIDASNDVWFDLDLANYRQQLVKGYSRMTPDNGLEMYLPDVGKVMPPGEVSLDTLRDRSRPLPKPAGK
ncbi:MAG TPA: hypothetical protein VL495_07825 [Edaphobacter sp.]|jgi:hypothetical protein|nr:hypothetical protein [Edaphobacter sp.]